MRKQVDFDVRVFPLGNGANDTMTHEQVGQFVRDNYLHKPNPKPDDRGYWEVFNTATNQISAGTIYYQVTLVKFEDAPLEKVVSAK